MVSKVVYCNNTIVGVYSRRLNVSRQLMAPKVQIVTGTAGRSFLIIITSKDFLLLMIIRGPS